MDRVIPEEEIGNCYEASFELALSLATYTYLDVYLVHGMPTNTGDYVGKKYGHAWVEVWFKDIWMVFDFSNGRRIVIAGPTYYKAGEIKEEELIRYTPEEAIDNAESVEHMGPWDSMFDGCVFLEETENEQQSRR